MVHTGYRILCLLPSRIVLFVCSVCFVVVWIITDRLVSTPYRLLFGLNIILVSSTSGIPFRFRGLKFFFLWSWTEIGVQIWKAIVVWAVVFRQEENGLRGTA